jgi:predicted lipoprotein with Yx(FWY)xxD motif
MDEQKAETKSAYGKRPIWQWIALYVVIGGIIYVAIYIAFFHKQNPYSYNTSSYQAKSMSQTQQVQNGVYKTMSKDKLGMVMTDMKGMTLYTFAKDSSGVSTCTGGCLKAWPAYIAPSKASNLPTNISVVARSDGTLQYAWKGLPLYYYSKDGDSGDAYGNGIGSVWSVIKM